MANSVNTNFRGGGNIKTPVNTEENCKFGGERRPPEIQFPGGKYKNTIKPVENERK